MSAEQLCQAVHTAIGHLRDGAVQDADDVLSRAVKAFHDAQMASGAEPEPAPAAFCELVIEALEFIASRFGNHPSLTRIIADLRKYV
jgi:hypothetical protein